MSKTAVVTGASRGIGYEICRTFANRKHHAIAVARSVDSLDELEQTAPKYIHAMPADLTDQQEVDDLVSNINEKVEGIDILINNAGALINKPFENLTLADWRSQLDSNLISAIHISRRLLPLFNDNAHIVNISSMGGFQGSSKFPGLAAYSVSKGALSILTECLADELKEHKIKANALCLGAVQTEMLDEAFPGIEAPVDPEEMGAYITDFALSASAFYNGQILPVTLGDPE